MMASWTLTFLILKFQMWQIAKDEGLEVGVKCVKV